MKNEKKIFDGDKVYAISVTLFSGVLAVGFVLMVVIDKIF